MEGGCEHVLFGYHPIQKVDIMGYVVRVATRSWCLEISLDDGTDMVDCRLKLDTQATSDQTLRPKLGDLYHVMGRLKRPRQRHDQLERPRRIVEVDTWVMVHDKNEEILHWLQVEELCTKLYSPQPEWYPPETESSNQMATPSEDMKQAESMIKERNIDLPSLLQEKVLQRMNETDKHRDLGGGEYTNAQDLVNSTLHRVDDLLDSPLIRKVLFELADDSSAREVLRDSLQRLVERGFIYQHDREGTIYGLVTHLTILAPAILQVVGKFMVGVFLHQMSDLDC